MEKVKETICYSRQAEKYMVEKFQEDGDYWAQFGVEPPTTFFGSDKSVSRIHPARHLKECGTYDNTRRPWYVAATSGPKDVILVLDNSGSMAKSGRMHLMKQAAARVIETLAIGDHIAVVTFSTIASYLLQPTMVQATQQNKEKLLKAIDSLGAFGATNFMGAFDMAFKVLTQSRREEFSSFCHTAILFLTDGSMTVPTNVSADDVIDLILKRIRPAQKRSNHEVHIFLYSFGAEANEGDAPAVLQEIACKTGGIWSRVDDGGDLATAMAGYYKLFALGLGDKDNEGFVAWVDPYKFATGGILGTTVAAPVYDRSVSPHILLGAVGIDFTMAAMEKALGGDAGVEVERLVLQSTALCPQLNLSECAIQSFRLAAGGERSLCPGQCTDFVGVVPKPCRTTPDYPTTFWANKKTEGWAYSDRVCCEIGETRLANELTLEEIETRQCVSSVFDEAQSNGRVFTDDSKAALIFAPPLILRVAMILLPPTMMRII